MTKALTIDAAISCLTEGRLVVIPTETVYGLAGNALDPKAIKQIYQTKRRPSDNPLIIHLPDAQSVFQFAHKCDIAVTMAKFWPGPLTIITRHNHKISRQATGQSGLCAFRVPDHPIALEILSRSALPLAAPSANMANKTSPTSTQMLDPQILKNICGYVEGGRCRLGLESTVVEIVESKGIIIHRPGMITADQLHQTGIALLEKDNQSESGVLKSPGQKARHYAPDKPLILIKTPGSAQSFKLQNLFISHHFAKPAVLSFGRKAPLLPDFVKMHTTYELSETADLHEAAHNLFWAFDELALLDCDCIVCNVFPDMDIAKALNDRLQRAASFII